MRRRKRKTRRRPQLLFSTSPFNRDLAGQADRLIKLIEWREGGSRRGEKGKGEEK